MDPDLTEIGWRSGRGVLLTAYVSTRAGRPLQFRVLDTSNFYIRPDLDFDVTIPSGDYESIKRSAITEGVVVPFECEIDKALRFIRMSTASKVEPAIVTIISFDDDSRIIISQDRGWWIMRRIGNGWRVEKMSLTPEHYE